MMDDDTRRLIERAGLDPDSAVELSGGSGTPVVRIGLLVAKHYRPGFDDWSGLGPIGTAAKVAGVAEALPDRGVPVPAVVRHVADGEGALVVWEAIDAGPLAPHHRVEAARVLRRLHRIEVRSLPGSVSSLIASSRPNGGRTRLGVEASAGTLDRIDPAWRTSTLGIRARRLLESIEPPPGASLVHGDFFSVNLLSGGGTVRVADWDLASAGDPMWDLAFLVCADRDLPVDLVDAVIDAYGHDALNEGSLSWHRECWALFWELRDAVEAAGGRCGAVEARPQGAAP